MDNIEDYITGLCNKYIPIYEKDCHNADGKKCERDCRLTIDYKQTMRAGLKKRLIELVDMAKAEGKEIAKAEQQEISKKAWKEISKRLID